MTNAIERAVLPCPQCEGEGSYADGLDEAACSTDCTRCGGNGWIADASALMLRPVTLAIKVIKRKPQVAGRWPPSMTPAEIEQAINAVCGCKADWDCDCVSVFNKACGDAWGRHNTTGKGAV